MSAKNKPLSKAHKDALRRAALDRHNQRKQAAAAAPTGLPYITPPDPPAPKPGVGPPAVPETVPARSVASDTAHAAPYVSVATADGPPVLARVVPPPIAVNNALVAQANELSAAQPAPPPTPKQLFTAWLRGREGVSASDPRMPSDPVRQGAELEDRLFVAFLAGYVGREGT